MKPLSIALAASAICTVSATAPQARADVEPDPQHDVSLTFSPIHLALPVFEAQAEFKLSPKLGLAGIFGVGGISSSSSSGTSISALVLEFGAKVAWYAVGDFEEGLQLGLEVLYVNLSGEGQNDVEESSFVGSGLSVGPFIGYKIVADVGFTFEAQLGPALIIATASSEDSEASSTRLGPLLNLNVGWSL